MSDGDTFTLLDGGQRQHAIRIAGIDAPERKQPFGTASKEALSRMIFNRRVEVRCYKRDRYGREVCRVYGQAMRDVGLEQVRAGMAWHFKEYAHEQGSQERLAYTDAEDGAKAAKHGLWAGQTQVPPWTWRKDGRKK